MDSSFETSPTVQYVGNYTSSFGNYPISCKFITVWLWCTTSHHVLAKNFWLYIWSHFNFVCKLTVLLSCKIMSKKLMFIYTQVSDHVKLSVLKEHPQPNTIFFCSAKYNDVYLHLCKMNCTFFFFLSQNLPFLRHQNLQNICFVSWLSQNWHG